MTDTEACVVIVGGGQAGYQTAESLRGEGYEGRITLLGGEPYAPYQRPPLSKAYLLGNVDKQRLKFRAEQYYTDHAIDLQTGTTVVSVDRAKRSLGLKDGTSLPYDQLVLATGARMRKLAVPGAELNGVFYLKTIDDVDRIEAQLGTATKVVVIGAGFIGLEFAAVAAQLGKDVTVLEATPRVMSRVVSPELSEFFTRTHESHGVSIVCDAMVSEIAGNSDAVETVVCDDGTSYPADMVVVGIGVIPDTDLAEASGLACDNGIIVDRFCRTADPHVFAAGDCTACHHPFVGRLIRLESVQNAADQGRTVAATITGHEKPYDTVPWFWSDQYDLKLQMVGLKDGGDEAVIRGDMDTGKFSQFHFRKGVLRAIDSVNRPADHIQGRKLLAAGLSPTPQQAADPDFSLKDLLAQAA